MRDVLMVALMIASIALFAAYVACCDRIIGRTEAVADTRGVTKPADDLERAG